jgi:hypothetical protein
MENNNDNIDDVQWPLLCGSLILLITLSFNFFKNQKLKIFKFQFFF